MKLSTRTRYGTKAMLDLAIHYAQGPILLKLIAMREGISESYLENLMTGLKTAGLVRTVRGPQGGHFLARPPSQIKLSEIVIALEGPIALVDCIDDARLCYRSPSCVTRDVWQDLNKAITAVLERITLEEMAQKQRERAEQGRPERARAYRAV